MDGQPMFLPFETDPDDDCGFLLGSGGSADVTNVDREDERRCLILPGALAAAFVAEDVIDGDVLLRDPVVGTPNPVVASAMFRRTSVNAEGLILMQKKNRRSL